MNSYIKSIKIEFVDDNLIEVVSEDLEYGNIRWRQRPDGELFSDVGDDDWRPVTRWNPATEPSMDSAMHLENDIYDAVKIAFNAAYRMTADEVAVVLFAKLANDEWLVTRDGQVFTWDGTVFSHVNKEDAEADEILPRMAIFVHPSDLSPIV